MLKQSDIQDVYSLSSMQEGIFFHYNMNKESTVYFEQVDIGIQGKLDINVLEESFNALIQRYSVLRTVFTSQKLKKPQQVVLKKRSSKIYYRDISTQDLGTRNIYMQSFKEEDKQKGFNLSKDIPMRISVLKMAGDTWRIILSFHHIILDGWSVGIIYDELLSLYYLLLKGVSLTLAPVKEYKEYIKWLENQDIPKGLAYWQNYLEGYEQPAILHVSYAPPPTAQYIREECRFMIDRETTGNLNQLARDNQVTLNILFQALWGILLKKYNNTPDVVFGIIVSGRPSEIKGINRMVGLLLNNIPIRIRMKDECSFSQLIRDIQEQELLSKSYEYLPLDQIQARSALKQSLINHIMVFENYPIQDAVRNLEIKDFGFSIEGINIYEQTNYDFVIIIGPKENIIVEFQYNSLVYQTKVVKQIAAHFQELIIRAVENPGISIRELREISGQRKMEILTYFNEDLKKEAVALLSEDETIQGQLLESFRRYSNKTALEYGPRTMTYAELEEKSRAAAQWIIHNHIEKETYWGILVEDRIELIVSVLGVLRAGCVIVPFYSAYPEERIEAMVYSTNIQYIIIDEHNYRRFQHRELLKGNRTCIFPRDLYSHHFTNVDREKEPRYSPGYKLYIHFTSGTTGTPKAIIGRNNSLLHFIRWEIRTFGITPGTNRTAQLTIPGFDPFLRDIFVPLLTGGAICIPENKDIVIHAAALVRWVNRYSITLIHCVSSLFRLLNSIPITAEDFQALRVIMLAGEKITPADLVKWYHTFGDRIQLANCYGPTETTMSKVCYLMNAADRKRERIPIGNPITGARVIILDEKMNICDTLEPGEICIRTPYRSYGYYNDEEANRTKFIVNPFNNDPDDIIYRSGDLGRLLPDGSIDILGRIDRQVKVRGHRVELEEIEHVLTACDLVKEAVLVKKEISNNNEFLCAFIVPVTERHQETGGKKLAVEIKEYLETKLPEYMVPAKLIAIENMPRKATGKVDHWKLYDILRDELIDHDTSRDLFEKRLAELWSGILGIENIGLNRRFFDLGGSSLNVMTLISRIHREFDIRISLADFFNNPTIEKQAGILRDSFKKEIYNSIQEVEAKGYYALSAAQNRLYMLQLMAPESTAYNLPSIVKLRGDLEIKRLEETFKKLIQRHESLRTSFELINGDPLQKIHRQVDFKVEYYENLEHAGNTTAKKREQEILGVFIRPFALNKAPLVRVGLMKTREKEFILIVNLHHIIADGASLGILVKEFMELYEGRQLPLLRLQYKDFVQWQNTWQHEILKKSQEDHWKREFEEFGQLKPLNLHPDYQRPPVLSFEGSTVSFEIHQEHIEKLKALALEEGATFFTVLFALYIIMLAKISGQKDIVVGTLVEGRNHADLENIIGMFVNTLALRFLYDGRKTFCQFLEMVHKKLLTAFENQDYQFEKLVKLVLSDRDESRNPLFDAMFVLQNNDMKELEIPGVKMQPFKMVNANSTSKFDITLYCLEVRDNYFFSIEYRTALFKKEKIERYARYFEQILRVVTENKYMKLEEIDIEHELSTIEFNRHSVKAEFKF